MKPPAPPGGFLRGDTFLVLAAVALAQATFLADLFFPLGVAGGVPYVFVVLLGLRFTRLRSILLTAAAVTLLIVAGAILPTPQEQGWSSIAPRLVTTFAVWGIALILIRHTRMHRALEAKRREARDYLDIVEVVIVALDEQGRVSLINRKGCEILGCDPGSIVGSDWFENHIPRRMRDQVRAVFRKIIAGTTDVTEYFENPLLTRTGGERIIAWHNAPLKDTHGRIIGTLSSGEDVTDRRRNEERLRQQEALARLGQMAAVVAHEVRNPLAGISGAVEILQGRAPEGSADREILTTIRERIWILDQSVEDLLRFARPRNPRPQALRPERLHLRAGCGDPLRCGYDPRGLPESLPERGPRHGDARQDRCADRGRGRRLPGGGGRRRPRHFPRCPAPGLRAVLHHQDPGHGPRSSHCQAAGGAERRGDRFGSRRARDGNHHRGPPSPQPLARVSGPVPSGPDYS